MQLKYRALGGFVGWIFKHHEIILTANGIQVLLSKRQQRACHYGCPSGAIVVRGCLQISNQRYASCQSLSSRTGHGTTQNAVMRHFLSFLFFSRRSRGIDDARMRCIIDSLWHDESIMCADSSPTRYPRSSKLHGTHTHIHTYTHTHMHTYIQLTFRVTRRRMPPMPMRPEHIPTRINTVSTWSSMWCAVRVTPPPLADAHRPSAA